MLVIRCRVLVEVGSGVSSGSSGGDDSDTSS